LAEEVKITEDVFEKVAPIERVPVLSEKDEGLPTTSNQFF